MKYLYRSRPGVNLNFENPCRRMIFVSVLSILTLYSLSVKAQSYVVNYSGLDLDPHGLVYYPAKKMLIISSLKAGQIGSIDGRGRYTLLLKDTVLSSASTVKIKDNFLYALTAIADQTPPKVAKLVKIDLLTKQIVSVTPLDQLYNGPHLVNDFTIDNNGTVYITDGLSPVIYRVDANGSKSVFLSDSSLNLNGQQLRAIAYHQNGYLLVAVKKRGILKIDLKNNNAVSEVDIEDNMQSINSLHFSPNHLLIASEDGANKQLHILNSSNSWASGKVLRTDKWTYTNPVNTEYVNNQIFVLDNKSSSGLSSGPANSTFSVRVIDLQKRPLNRRRMKIKITTGEMVPSKTF